MRALVTGEGYTDAHFAALRAADFDVRYCSTLAPDRVRDMLRDIDVHILGGSERLDAATLSSTASLKLISFAGTGIGSFVDVAAATRKGIALRTTPGINTDAVAEHTIGLIFGLSRGLFAHNEAVKRDAGFSEPPLQLADMTIGILGMGRIGSRVASLLDPFGPKLVYANRSPSPRLETAIGMQRVDVEELYATVDMAVLLVASSTETRGMVGADELAKMRRGIRIVNTASADLVDPWALRQAIDRGDVAAAAFDGYWIEPLPHPDDDPYGLLSLPDRQFVVTPHCAARTPGIWLKMLDAAVANAVADA